MADQLEELLQSNTDSAEMDRQRALALLAQQRAYSAEGLAPAPQKSMSEGLAELLVGALPALVGAGGGYLGKAAGASAGASAIQSLQQRSDEDRKARAAQLLMLGKLSGDESKYYQDSAKTAERDVFNTKIKQADLSSRSEEKKLDRQAAMDRVTARPAPGETPLSQTEIDSWKTQYPDKPVPKTKGEFGNLLSLDKQAGLEKGEERRSREFEEVKLANVETKARNDIDNLMKARLPSKFPDSVQTFALLDQFLSNPNASTLALSKTMFARLYDTGALSNKDIDRYLQSTAWGSLKNLQNWATGSADPNLTDAQADAAFGALKLALGQAKNTLSGVEGAIKARRGTYKMLDDETFNDVVSSSYGAQREIIDGLLDKATTPTNGASVVPNRSSYDLTTPEGKQKYLDALNAFNGAK